MCVYVARYAMQQRSEIEAMPLSTFIAWHSATSEMIKRENEAE
jgi:hypothetical protein